MKQTDIDTAIDIVRTYAKKYSTHPGQVLMQINALMELISNSCGLSQRDSVTLNKLLIANDLITIHHNFVILTHDGYALTTDDDTVPSLQIPLQDILKVNSANLDETFYSLWDIIGPDKEENPFYVDGKTFYDTARGFISEGLPPSWSKYTSALHEQGKSTSRIDLFAILFHSIPVDEIPDFLRLLSDKINARTARQNQPGTEPDADTDIDLGVIELPLALPDTSNQTTAVTADTADIPGQKTPKIFISHNSLDADYAKAIVNLLIALGINEEENVFCSSLPGCGVPFGHSFIEEIKAQYENHQLIMIFIHSPRFYQSHVSLCEMGAAWILSYRHLSFLTHDCTFDMLDAVIPSTETAFRAGQSNTYPLLNDFKALMESEFHLQPKSLSRWEDIKSDFIRAVESIQYKH